MDRIDLIIKKAKKKPIQELLNFSIINLDKPSGPTSFFVSDYIRKGLELKKTGHFGTLDPAVTGVLPVCLSKACRLTEYFLKKDKTYVGVMNLHNEISEKKLKKEISYFLGIIKQIPPKRSKVLRREREREIYEFKILEKRGRDVLFEVRCEAGTYIRKLCHDLGEKIGGAHMAELRRVKAGIFSEKDKEFINLYEFEKAVLEYKLGKEEKLRKILIPGEIIYKILPFIEIKEEEEILKKIYNGYPIYNNYLLGKKFNQKKISETKQNQKIAILYKDLFVGVYRVVQESEIFAKPEFVFKSQ